MLLHLGKLLNLGLQQKLGWHRSFLTVESTRGIRAQVVVFELLEEIHLNRFRMHF